MTRSDEMMLSVIRLKVAMQMNGRDVSVEGDRVKISQCRSGNSDLRASIDATIFAVSFSSVMYCLSPSRANHLDQQSPFYGPVGHIVDSDYLLGGGPATTFRRFSQRRESATTFRLLACDRLPRFILLDSITGYRSQFHEYATLIRATEGG